MFAARLTRLRKRMANEKLDALVVYGDREHFANLAWLTNYDPRFEEALLVVLPQGKPVLFIGNEGWSYSNYARLEVKRELYQTFSLLGQIAPEGKAARFIASQRGTGGRFACGRGRMGIFLGCGV